MISAIEKFEVMNHQNNFDAINQQNQNNNIIQFPTIVKDKTMAEKQKPSSRKGVSCRTHALTEEDIPRAKEYFLNANYKFTSQNLRNYALFVLGLNTARRIGDIVTLQIKDIFDSKGNFRDWVEIREEKTGKYADFQLNPYVREAIANYLNARDDYKQEDDYLFLSNKAKGEHITTNCAWRIMKDMSKALELEYNIGTHTMRKTWTQQQIQSNLDNPNIIAAVSNELNHRDIKTTFIYCGYDRKLRTGLYNNNI